MLLAVGFVRQHHLTCVPATLTAISRFWSMPADHLSVAEAICYDGTPSHSERSWAEQSGWVAREFTVTWESAVALLDRGVPFTLTTSDPVNGHLQAVIGYDRRRRTLLIRDPYHRHFAEALADEVLEGLRSTGPRGMALVPRGQAALLEGAPPRSGGPELPDTALYDLHHGLQRALLGHDRGEAQQICEELRATAPEHRLTLQARRSLATYDSDRTELLACAEGLLALFPDDGALLLLQLSCLRELARREERIALLKAVCARKECHPVFWQQYAQELAPDAREHRAAIRLLRRALRARPGDGGSVYLLARLLWDQRRFDEALRLYRFAACLDDKNEAISKGYFFASRHLKQTAATIQFLQSRFRRFGRLSSQPARTLFWALSEIDRTTEAFQVLETALQLRPEDGELRLFAAEAYSRHGEPERAAEHLAAAEGKSQRTGWLRTAAALALHRGELKAALSLQREVVEAEPLDAEAQRVVAQLIAETDSQAAALEYLRGVTERFPYHHRLHQLWIEWLREEGPEAQEGAIRHVIEINPVDAWAHQELALCLAQQRRFDEALGESEIAGRLDPTSPGRWCVHGQICMRAGQTEEARESYRQAIRLSVDTEYAIRALVAACDSPAERREALAFIESELIRQTIFGDGLLAFREQARPVLPPEELLALLRKALKARPDLWHAWAAMIGQLVDMDRLDEAVGLAREATARFPLLPRLWLDLAHVQEARAERPDEREALEQALRISPGWGPAVAQLASLYERTGEFERAKSMLEQAVARSPLDPLCHGWLAQALWRLGEREAAVEHVERALELEPGYEWAWEALRRWTPELEGPESERAAAVARRLTERRPGEARSWLVLARTLAGEEALPERLAALDRAISLNPRNVEAYELKAELLAEARRFEEALAACRPEAWAGEPPSPLRTRAAWVEAERGNAREAIAQMRAVVADDPQFYRGWYELARWYEQSGAHAEYGEAAQKLTELQPQNPQSFAVLADARLRAGDRARAKSAFRRAFELDPDYAFAGMSLFDMQLEDSELPAAAETLERLRRYVGGSTPSGRSWVQAQEVQLAVRRGDRAAAVRGLRDLCGAKEAEAWSLYAAARVMSEAGWRDSVEQLFEEALERPDVHPEVGGLWVRSRIARGDWDCVKRLAGLRGAPPRSGGPGRIGVEATATYLELLGEAQWVRHLRRFIDEHSGLLRRETATWASAGYALISVNDTRRTALWLADWQSRPGLKPWMLLPLAVALRALGREEEAIAVSRHALGLSTEDAKRGCHTVWLAADHALAGETDPAANLLASVDPASLNRYYQFLYTLARGAVELQAAGPGERAKIFTGVRLQVRGAAPRGADLQCAAVRRAHRRLALRIAQDAGGVLARLWAWAQMLNGAGS